MIGRRLANYEIVDEISRGGMGVVYRARDLDLGRDVALKVLPDDLVHDAARRERLLQEARAASALEHPHIAVIHAVGTAGGVTYIAMELIRGGKLADALGRGPLPPKRALDLAIEVAEGMARAHDRGIVHRDLKPANVMLTDDGHAKVIDFGLAKLVEPVSADGATATMRAPRTEPGTVMGTVSYMSPEQARGADVDHRSDVFSFGVMLHEMLTGRVPFTGQSELDTLHAILKQPLPPLTPLDLSDAAAHEIQRVLAKCTAKEPDDRYQGMKDVVVDLRAARRGLESAPLSSVMSTSAASRATERPATRAMGVAAILALAGAIGLFAVLWFFRPWEAGPPPADAGDKPALAVLFFDNQTGDPSLDWMRTGLADMMVTDLSQLPEIEVLGTDRIYQMLRDMRLGDDRMIPADAVQQIASRAGVDRVLVGSFVKAGDQIRINARLQEADTGRIVTAERVEGPGESNLFSLVDDLARRIKSQMMLLARAGRPGGLLERPGAEPETGLDRGLTEITTSSIDAYRYYAEGMHLHERFLEAQALPLLERALELDPTFAMAMAKLAVVANNLGLWDKRDEYARRALEHSDRLTTRERYYIEGFHYSLRPETTERAIEAYRQGLALHPEHQASRHNLALALAALDRFDEAAAEYEELRRRRTSNPTTYGNLADIYASQGDVTRAMAVLDEFLLRYPENAQAHHALGEVLVTEGRLADARAAFDRAFALDPQDFRPRLGLWMSAVMQERFDEAEAVRVRLAEATSPFERWVSLMMAALQDAAWGRSEAMLQNLDRASRLSGSSTIDRVQARMFQANSLLALGRPTLALPVADAIQADASRVGAAREALATLAHAQAAAGRSTEARRTVARLDEMAAALPRPDVRRAADLARGLVALEAGDAASAIDALTRAANGLTARGPVTAPAPHVAWWFHVARTHLAAGRDADAARWLERVTGAGHERAFDFLSYVRAHYLLAELLEKRGDAARARQFYRRFVDYWGDGDIDRDRIAIARRKLQ